MDGTEISKEEAFKLIEQIKGKAVKAHVRYGGAIHLEIGEITDELDTTPKGETFSSPVGEYSVSIDGDWVVSNKKKRIKRDDSTGSKDSEKIHNFVGNSTIIGLGIVDNKKTVNIILNNDVEIGITGTTSDSDYFYLTSRGNKLEGLVLSSQFKFIKIPRG